MAVMFRTEGLAKSFGARRALDGVDLEVAAGTVLGLLGPTGPVLSPVLQTLAWSAALTVVFAPLAVRQFRRLS